MARKKNKSKPKVSTTITAPANPGALANAITFGLIIFFLSVIIYIPAMSAGFIWDDDQLLTVNPQVHSPDGWWRLWFSPTTADYFPLTSSTFWLEWRLWGMNGAGYHITNILSHGVVAVLTWRVLRALQIPGAWLAALIFGVHPVCVESVAWISERKNTISQIFFLLTLLAYFRFQRNEKGTTYVLAVVCFALALLAKTSVVMLPFVLLLCAWWQHGFAGLRSDLVEDKNERWLLRVTNAVVGVIGIGGGVMAMFFLHDLTQKFHANPHDPEVVATNMFVSGSLPPLFWGLAAICVVSGIVGLSEGVFAQRFNRHLIRTLAFFQIAVLLGAVTVWFQYGRAIGTEVIPIGGPASRIAKAGMAVWFYISKDLFPYPLSAIYETWKVTPPAWYEFLPDVALVAIFIFCWRKRAAAWARAALFALGYFVITMLPALGFLTMSYMRLTLVADHFQYLSMIGIVALVVAAGARWLPRTLGIGLAAVIVLIFCELSWSQATIYLSEETLWRDTLQKNPDTWQGHNHMGAALYSRGEKAEAFKHFQRAVQLKPENPEVHNNLGLGYATFAQHPDGTLDPVLMNKAIEEYQRAITIKDDPSMRMNLGNALGAMKRYDEAVEQYRAATQMSPDNPNMFSALGYVLMQQGRVDEAIDAFRHAVQIAPNVPQFQQNLNAALGEKKRQQGR